MEENRIETGKLALVNLKEGGSIIGVVKMQGEVCTENGVSYFYQIFCGENYIFTVMKDDIEQIMNCERIPAEEEHTEVSVPSAIESFGNHHLKKERWHYGR